MPSSSFHDFVVDLKLKTAPFEGTKYTPQQVSLIRDVVGKDKEIQIGCQIFPCWDVWKRVIGTGSGDPTLMGKASLLLYYDSVCSWLTSVASQGTFEGDTVEKTIAGLGVRRQKLVEC